MFAHFKHLIGKKIRQKRRRTLRQQLPGLRDGQINHLMYLRDHIPIRGSRVLEIGGDLDALFARGIRLLGASSVVSTNIADGFESAPAFPGIEHIHMDARQLDFPNDSFDLVIGVAILEHLHDIPLALSQVAQVLRPGGYAYLHGGPLWQGPKGHHIWLDAPSGKKYRFTGDNPIHDWEHVYSSREGILDRLKSTSMSEPDARAVVTQIFEDDFVNRTTTADLKAYFQASELRVKDLRTESSAPPPDVAALLESRSDHPSTDHAISSAAFLVQKMA